MTDSWLLKIEPKARKQLAKLDPHVERKVLLALSELSRTDNPVEHCEQLRGNFRGLYKFRIQNLRAVFDIVIREHTIEVVRVGWRKDVYD